MTFKRLATVFSILAMLTLFCLSVQAQEMNIDSAIESLRADFRADKVAIITQAMQFNDKDAVAFWPIYKNMNLTCRN